MFPGCMKLNDKNMNIMNNMYIINMNMFMNDMNKINDNINSKWMDNMNNYRNAMNI